MYNSRACVPLRSREDVPFEGVSQSWLGWLRVRGTSRERFLGWNLRGVRGARANLRLSTRPPNQFQTTKSIPKHPALKFSSKAHEPVQCYSLGSGNTKCLRNTRKSSLIIVEALSLFNSWFYFFIFSFFVTFLHISCSTSPSFCSSFYTIPVFFCSSSYYTTLLHVQLH